MRNKISLPLLASIAALTPLAVDMYLPAIPGIADDLGSDISVIQNSLSIFLVGFGFGMLFFGPNSDRYGRRPLALFGLTGFAIASYLISFSTSAGMFLALRLVQGFLGSAASVVIPAMIRDCYGKDTAKGMSAVTIFQFLTAYALIILVITFWRLKETKPEDNNSIPRTFFGNYKIIFSNHSIYLDLLCFMLTALTFFTYLTSASFIYISYFGVSSTAFGILFSCTASSLICANFINIRIGSRFGPRKIMQAGIATSIVFTAALVLVSYLDLGVYWTLACFVFIIGSLGITSINADALVIIEFPNQASSASAVMGTLRFGTGAFAGPILAIIYSGTPKPIAVMMFCIMFTAGVAQLFKAKQLARNSKN